MGKGDATREQIVKEALSQALAIGLEGVSLGKLAEGLSLSKSGLFAHFKSKETLQLAVVEEAIHQFTKTVVLPAIAKPRGEPRVRALFENWMLWAREREGCIFMVLSTEFDDRPGPIRDLLVRAQEDWREAMMRAVTLAKREGHFARNVDPAQFAFEMKGIMMALHEATKLFRDRHAPERARRAFAALIERSRC